MSSRRVSMPSSLFKTIEEDPKDQCSGVIRGKTRGDICSSITYMSIQATFLTGLQILKLKLLWKYDPKDCSGVIREKNNKGFWIRWPLSFFVVCFLYHPICVVLWYINLDIAGLQILWKMTFTDTLVKIGYLLQTFVKHSMAISKIGVNKTYFLVTFLSAKTNWIFISIVFKLQRNTMCQPPGVSYKLAQLEHEETFIRHNWNWKLEKKKHSKVITSVCNTILTESIF